MGGPFSGKLAAVSVLVNENLTGDAHVLGNFLLGEVHRHFGLHHAWSTGLLKSHRYNQQEHVPKNKNIHKEHQTHVFLTSHDAECLNDRAHI